MGVHKTSERTKAKLQASQQTGIKKIVPMHFFVLLRLFMMPLSYSWCLQRINFAVLFWTLAEIGEWLWADTHSIPINTQPVIFLPFTVSLTRGMRMHLLRRLIFSWGKTCDHNLSRLLNGRIINSFLNWTVEFILPALSDINYCNEKYNLSLQLISISSSVLIHIH